MDEVVESVLKKLNEMLDEFPKPTTVMYEMNYCYMFWRYEDCEFKIEYHRSGKSQPYWLLKLDEKVYNGGSFNSMNRYLKNVKVSSLMNIMTL